MQRKNEARSKTRDTEPVTTAFEAIKPLRPRQCRRYLQKTLANEFRSIVKGFVKEARKGGCAHMKLAAELVEDKAVVRKRVKGTAQKLLEELGE